MSLLERMRRADGPEGMLEVFVDWASQRGFDLYPAQEEAILETLAGSNVILATPTGSGKSLVALAAHAATIARGGRAWYTAPIKALVAEKFFDLCGILGPEQVGMLTGDAAINPDAPLICATAEVLAHHVLRTGSDAGVDHLVADEFHFYADPDRGWAWQVPLLELARTQFLLMSATLGDTTRFEEVLGTLTGRPTTTVAGAERPVPLEYTWRETPLHETVTDLVESGRVPAYLVFFTQAEAFAAAQRLASIDVADRSRKEAIGAALRGFRFTSPVGAELRRLLRHGIGVHHAGMLPRYRLLVEQLAQQGLLQLICGTDTLGVGINVPIRTVVFTRLHKFDGRRQRLLTAREFHQIAGRAGRKGFDDVGYVWCQAPEHVIENRRLAERAAADPRKARKMRRKSPPDRGYVHWDERVFRRLAGAAPEPLGSSFEVSHAMVLSVLDRPGDGCAALRRLLLSCHEPRPRLRRHIRRAIHIYRSLTGAGVIEALPEPDEQGRRVRITVELPESFALHQPLSPFVLEAVEHLDPDHPDHALDVLTVVEATLEDPMPVLLAQRDRERKRVLAELKAAGVPYEDRMAELAEVSWPRPLEGFLWDSFVAFARRHPWVGSEQLHPKSVAREMAETGATFAEMVTTLGLKRCEGVLLRYLTDVYRAMVRTVPPTARTDRVEELTDWLGATVRAVDASLLETWESLLTVGATGSPEAGEPVEVPSFATNERALRRAVRSRMWRWVQALARRDTDALVPDCRPGLDPAAAMAPYWDEHDVLHTDADAAGPHRFIFEPEAGRALQILADPAGWDEWVLEATFAVSEGEPEIRLTDIRRR